MSTKATNCFKFIVYAILLLSNEHEFKLFVTNTETHHIEGDQYQTSSGHFRHMSAQLNATNLPLLSSQILAFVCFMIQIESRIKRRLEKMESNLRRNNYILYYQHEDAGLQVAADWLFIGCL